jgi:hypothetical protein
LDPEPALRLGRRGILRRDVARRKTIMIDPYNDTATGGNGPDRREHGEAFGDLLSPAMRNTLAEQEHRVRELIRSRPFASVLGALAFGYVVARLMRNSAR